MATTHLEKLWGHHIIECAKIEKIMGHYGWYKNPNVEQKKPEEKEYRLYDSIYVNYKIRMFFSFLSSGKELIKKRVQDWCFWHPGRYCFFSMSAKDVDIFNLWKCIKLFTCNMYTDSVRTLCLNWEGKITQKEVSAKDRHGSKHTVLSTHVTVMLHTWKCYKKQCYFN